MEDEGVYYCPLCKHPVDGSGYCFYCRGGITYDPVEGEYLNGR